MSTLTFNMAAPHTVKSAVSEDSWGWGVALVCACSSPCLHSSQPLPCVVRCFLPFREVTAPTDACPQCPVPSASPPLCVAVARWLPSQSRNLSAAQEYFFPSLQNGKSLPLAQGCLVPQCHPQVIVQNADLRPHLRPINQDLGEMQKSPFLTSTPEAASWQLVQ